MGNSSSTTTSNFDAKSYVDDLVKNNPVVIFSKSYCPYCDDAKAIFKKLGVSYISPELDVVPNGKAIHNYVKKITDEPTVPNMHILGKFIGGHEDLIDLQKKGDLTSLIQQVKRVLIKGGVWKNTEDEILKAAVMKYGKNQWARISSLLVRKTPKQCKARWFEWLDPSIKKTEWAKDEDEKLLHLAKLMPTQWRTIAPIVGRTPAQCLERYQKLLDDAEIAVGDEDAGVTGDDVRKLRPGEVDPDPETKPARPDPVDMDEDEKEMLSEARARLANTQGKKAKRKAREKQLEEARRLALLQKRREMKAAGIDMRIKRKLKGMDYNADIPFHAPAKEGFWNTLEEKDREKGEKKDLTDTLLSKLEGKRRADIEDDLRKKDAKKQKVKRETADYVDPQAIKAAKEAELLISQRKKLVLPVPQVTDSELEEIVKIGYSGESAKAMVETTAAVGGGGSSGLLSDYSSVRAPTPQRTPRVAATADPLKMEARNLKAMTDSQTPLLGGHVEMEGDLHFGGATPKRTVAHTPNPLAAHLTPRTGGSGGETPRGGAGGQTPMLRDEMGINTPRAGSGSGGGARPQFEETPRGERARQSLIRQQLSSLFSKLPKPSNDFEIVVPDDNSNEAGGGEEDAANAMEEDAADVYARNQKLNQQIESDRLARRSQAVKKELPRPLLIRPGCFAADASESEVDNIVRQEMLLLLKHDTKMYPVPGQIISTSDYHHQQEVATLEEISDSLLASAKDLMSKEAEDFKKQLITQASLKNEEELDEAFWRAHEESAKKFMYIPSEGHGLGQYREVRSISLAEKVAILKAHLDKNRELMKKEAIKASKLEKKLAVTLGGYQARAAKLKKDLADRYKEYQDLDIQYVSFLNLQSSVEIPGLESRREKLELEVKAAIVREGDAQARYAELSRERDEILAIRN